MTGTGERVAGSKIPEAEGSSVPAIAMAIAALVALTFLVWIPVLHCGFLYDDHMQIETNPELRSWSSAGHLLTNPLWTEMGHGQSSPYYRPLFSLLLICQYQAFGLNPTAWHLVSLSLHLLVTLAIFTFLAIHFNRVLPALLGSSLFAISPATAEVVGWISASEEALCTLLILVSLCGIAARRRIEDRGLLRMFRIVSLLALAAALFAKETAIIGVILATAYEYRFGIGRIRARLLPYLMVLPAIAVCALEHSQMELAKSRPLAQTAFAIPRVLGFAVKKIFWPVPVSAFYNAWFGQPHSPWSFIAIPIFLGLFVALAVLLWRTQKHWFELWSCMFMLLPILVWIGSLKVLPDYSFLHDRYMYMPLAGFVLLIAAGMAKLTTHGRSALWIFAPLALLVVDVVCIRHEIGQFQNDFEYFSNAASVAPRNLLAIDLLAETELQRGACAKAQEIYQYGETLRPDLWRSGFYLGIAYMRCGMAGPAADAFNRSITTHDGTSEEYGLAWYELARARLVQGDEKAAEEAMQQAAQLDPGSRKIRALMHEIQSSRVRDAN